MNQNIFDGSFEPTQDGVDESYEESIDRPFTDDGSTSEYSSNATKIHRKVKNKSTKSKDDNTAEKLMENFKKKFEKLHQENLTLRRQKILNEVDFNFYEHRAQNQLLQSEKLKQIKECKLKFKLKRIALKKQKLIEAEILQAILRGEVATKVGLNQPSNVNGYNLDIMLNNYTPQNKALWERTLAHAKILKQVEDTKLPEIDKKIANQALFFKEMLSELQNKIANGV